MGKKEKGTFETRKVKILDEAFQDLNDVVDFIAIANQQPLNAIKVSEAIFDTIRKIQANPLAFKECEEIPTISKMYRKATCHSWYIVYRVTATEITILGIIHSSRRPSRIRRLRKIK